MAWKAMAAFVGVALTCGALGFLGGRASVPDKGTSSTGVNDIDTRDCSRAWTEVQNRGKDVIWSGLGDSYSAGVGGPQNGASFGQDLTHSFVVYAAQRFHSKEGLAVELDLSACSGALTSQIFADADGPLTPESISGNRDEAAFWYRFADPLRSLRSADVVTLTIGGNDAGFGNLAKSLVPGPGTCLRQGACTLLADGGIANGLSGDPEKEWTEIRARLERAYDVTLRLMPRDARLFVVQYPLAFAAPPAHPSGTCRVLAQSVGAEHMQLINRFAERLDVEIAQAAQHARTSDPAVDDARPRITVVGWGGEPITSVSASDRWSPNGLCSESPAIHSFAPLEHGLTVNDSFHPTDVGIELVGCSVARAVAANLPVKADAEGYELRDGACT